MINVNETVSNALISPVRDIKARVEFYEGSTLVEICNCNDRLINFTVERVGESKFFGFGICQKANIHLIDKNRELNFSTNNSIKIVFSIGSNGFYPYPTFKISEIHRDENTNELSITAYDLLYSGSNYFYSDLNMVAPYTLRTFATEAAIALNASGVKYDSNAVNAFALNLAEGGNYEGTETIRDCLTDIAEATQTIFYINSQDELVFKRLSKSAGPVFTISKAHYITSSSKTNRRLGKIVHTTALGDNLSVSTSQAGTTQHIRDNPIWTTFESSEIAGFLNEAITAVGGLTINQFDCSWRGNFLLEIGDKIGLITKDNEEVYSFVTDDVISYTGVLSERTSWEYADEVEESSNPITIGDKLNQTVATVDKINQKIDLIVSEGNNYAGIQLELDQISQKVSSLEQTDEEVNEKIGELVIKDNEILAKVNSLEQTDTTINQSISALEVKDGEILAKVSSLEQSDTAIKEDISSITIEQGNITASVQAVDKKVDESIEDTNAAIETLTKRVDATITEENVSIIIQQELANGTNSVTTSTGFVFDETGLTVSKSDSDMTTVIDEDGMTISRNSTEVLTADNTGVKATNLHALTYLMIGETSRFEDYDGGTRTGCFWIGR